MLKVLFRHPGAVLGAVILHLLLGGLFFFSFDWSEKPDLHEAGIPVALISEGSLETQANNEADEASNKPSEKQILKEKVEAQKTAEAEKKAEEQKQLEKELEQQKIADAEKEKATIAAAQALKLKKERNRCQKTPITAKKGAKRRTTTFGTRSCRTGESNR